MRSDLSCGRDSWHRYLGTEDEVQDRETQDRLTNGRRFLMAYPCRQVGPWAIEQPGDLCQPRLPGVRARLFLSFRIGPESKGSIRERVPWIWSCKDILSSYGGKGEKGVAAGCCQLATAERARKKKKKRGCCDKIRFFRVQSSPPALPTKAKENHQKKRPDKQYRVPTNHRPRQELASPKKISWISLDKPSISP